MSPFWFKQMQRAPAKHLAVLFVTLALAGLMCFLSVYRTRQEQKREEAIDNTQVLCVVTNPTGTQSTGLRMGYGAMQAVTLDAYYKLPAYVKDLRATKELKVDLPGVGANLDLLAVTLPDGIEALDPKLGGKVKLFREDFYTSEEPLLLVSEQVYDALAGKAQITGTVTDPQVNQSFTPDKGTGDAEFTVAGTYRGTGTAVYLPFYAGMAIVDRITGWRTVDSITFTAADNRALDELKEAASEMFGTVHDDLVESEHRFALTVHDEDLRMTVAALESGMRRANAMIPVTLLFALAAGFLMGLIATRSERNTYALMRSVGMTKKRLFGSALLGQLLLPFAACVGTGAAFLAPLPALGIFLLYALGCTAAVLRAASVSPTELLREQE